MAAPRHVFVDTHFLIWGIERKRRAEDEERFTKACALYDACRERGDAFVVSAVTVAEFLAKIPSKERPEYLDQLVRNFLVVPVDGLAAEHAAEVQHREFDGLKASYGSRRALKADVLILGCVLAFDPAMFYTEDKRFLSLARRHFPETHPYPEPPPKQGELFGTERQL